MMELVFVTRIETRCPVIWKFIDMRALKLGAAKATFRQLEGLSFYAAS